MKVSSYKSNCVEIIKKNLNGRKVVCYGKVDKELENYMKEAGIQIAFSVLRTKSLCDGEKFFDAAILQSMASEYYVVSFSSTNSEKDTNWIQNYGYQEGKDYMFMASSVTVVPKGSVNWYDKSGNTCSYCPENCHIKFAGHNSEVYIATNIKIKKQLNLTLGDDCKVYIGEKVNIIKECTWLVLGDYASLTVSDSVSVHESSIIMHSHSSLSIGSKTTFLDMMIKAFPNSKISIGCDCMFSQKIIMFAGDGHAIFDVEKAERINAPLDNLQDENRNTIKLGDHVWVGLSAKILQGSIVGSGSIIGMGAVVKGKFPNNCIIAGNSARIIRKNVAWSRDIMDMDIIECGEEFIHMTDDIDGDSRD